MLAAAGTGGPGVVKLFDPPVAVRRIVGPGGRTSHQGSARYNAEQKE